MESADWFLLALRLIHALAATVWLGGGVYYLLALRPAARSLEASQQQSQQSGLAGAAQARFGEWARVATLAMVATGVVLGVDGLSEGRGGVTYAVLLALKVVAALVAFWFAGVRPARRARKRGNARRAIPETILALGLFAYAVGIVISAVWGRGLA